MRGRTHIAMEVNQEAQAGQLVGLHGSKNTAGCFFDLFIWCNFSQFGAFLWGEILLLFKQLPDVIVWWQQRQKQILLLDKECGSQGRCIIDNLLPNLRPLTLLRGRSAWCANWLSSASRSLSSDLSILLGLEGLVWSPLPQSTTRWSAIFYIIVLNILRHLVSTLRILFQLFGGVGR